MFLVALCALPLIQPHLHMYLEQRRAINTLQIDHLASFLYADIVGKLYSNDFEWEDIVNSTTEHPIDTKDQDLKNMSYEASYSFKKLHAKPPSMSAAETNYLIEILIKIKSTNGKDFKKYKYDVFIKRKIKEGQDGVKPNETQKLDLG